MFEAIIMHEPANPIDSRNAGHDQPVFDKQRQVSRRMGFVWHDHKIGAEYRL